MDELENAAMTPARSELYGIQEANVITLKSEKLVKELRKKITTLKDKVEECWASNNMTRSNCPCKVASTLGYQGTPWSGFSFPNARRSAVNL